MQGCAKYMCVGAWGLCVLLGCAGYVYMCIQRVCLGGEVVDKVWCQGSCSTAKEVWE